MSRSPFKSISSLINTLGEMKSTHEGDPPGVFCEECLTFDRMELICAINDLFDDFLAQKLLDKPVTLKVPVPVLSSPLSVVEKSLLEAGDRKMNGWAPKILETGVPDSVVDEACTKIDDIFGDK